MKNFLLVCCLFLGLSQLAQGQASWQWARHLSQVTITATSTDAAGDVYVAGHFSTPVSFTSPYFSGTLTLTPVGTSDLFIGRLDAGGNLKWARQVGGAGAAAYGKAISPDVLGGVFVAGSFHGTLTVNTGPTSVVGPAVYTAALLLRCAAATGTTVWSRGIGNNGYNSSAATVVAGPNATCYLGGMAGGGSVNFNPIIMSMPNRTGYVAAYTSAGSAIWVKKCDHGGSPIGTSVDKVATDGAGNCYATGFFSTSLELGGLTLPSGGSVSRQTFVARLNPGSGSAVWLKGNTAATSGSESSGTGLSVNGSWCYLGGTFNGTENFGGGYTLTAGYPTTGYVAGYQSATGATVWVRPIGYANSGVAVAGDAGKVVATMGFEASTDYTKMVSYAPTGTFQWSQATSGPGSSSASDVALWGSLVYWSGSFQPPCVFGPFTLSGFAGTTYGFLARLNVTAAFARTGAPRLDVYPNPAASELHVTGADAKDGPLQLTVYTAFGKPVLTQKVGVAKLTLDLRRWPRGTYWVALDGADTHERRQIQVE
jgi:hypothetical protein